MEQKLRLAVEGGGVADLNLHPVERGAVGHVAMDDAACADLHHDEDVDRREQRRVLRHEIAGEEFVAVVLDEGSPLLTVITPPSADHVRADGTTSYLVYDLLNHRYNNWKNQAPLF